MGYIYALLCSLFFALYVIPRKHASSPAHSFVFWMSITYLFFSAIILAISQSQGIVEVWDNKLILAFIGGIIRFAGFFFFVSSIDEIGITRSNQWKNLAGPVGVIGSLVLLQEYNDVQTLSVLAGAFCIFLSALCFNRLQGTGNTKPSPSGVIKALIAALCFGSLAVINKYVTTHNGVYNQQFIWSIGTFISVLCYSATQGGISQLFTLPKKEKILGSIAGVFYTLASITLLLSFARIPASIGFTIIQLNAVWAVTIGILVYKEVEIKGNIVLIGAGYFLAVLAIVVLSFSR